MNQVLGMVTLVVRDYDEALAFYIEKLGFELIEDTAIPAEAKRWVVIKPHGSHSGCLLLARASTPEQLAAVGRQTGGRVFLFLYTDSITRDVETYTARGVEFIRRPTRQPHGIAAVFKDLYGNAWDLIEPSPENRSWQG